MKPRWMTSTERLVTVAVARLVRFSSLLYESAVSKIPFARQREIPLGRSIQIWLMVYEFLIHQVRKVYVIPFNAALELIRDKGTGHGISAAKKQKDLLFQFRQLFHGCNSRRVPQ